jgi:hypothetical protein
MGVNMSMNSLSMAVVPYTPPMSAWEFIESEIKRGISSGLISFEPQTHHPIPRPIPFDLVNINLNAISEMFKQTQITHNVCGNNFSNRS